MVPHPRRPREGKLSTLVCIAGKHRPPCRFTAPLPAPLRATLRGELVALQSDATPATVDLGFCRLGSGRD